MNLFLDTSALVKYFHEEEGSEVVTNFISSKENEIWLLELSRLEFIRGAFPICKAPTKYSSPGQRPGLGK